MYIWNRVLDQYKKDKNLIFPNTPAYRVPQHKILKLEAQK